MNNIYELFERCIQSEGTISSQCVYILDNNLPTKNYQFSTIFENTKDFSDDYNCYSEIKTISSIDTFNMDDALDYMNIFLKKLKEFEYLERFSISNSKFEDSLVIKLGVKNKNLENDIYDIFNLLPSSVNSRITTYIQ